MQVATLFRETAKLLGASMDGGSGMDNSKYCMKSETQADDGYETCVDAVYGNNMERMMGSGPQHMDMRHMGVNDHVLQQRQSMVSGMKMEQYGDPYSFVDEMPNACLPHSLGSNMVPLVKKRGRRKKSDAKIEDFGVGKRPHSRNEPIMDAKERKRHDRFNGLSEEEVSQRELPDHMSSNLDILIIGINPGLFAAFKGHHYAGPGNHFWKCLYLSGLVPEPLTADDDFNLLHYGIGFTNMVSRPTKGSADLTRREIKQGSQILLEKLQKFQPKIAVFNGKLIYEVFSGKKDFPFGRQQELVEGTNTYIWVMPSSSARCAQLPRAADKVPFYSALKKFRDYLNGLISDLDESEVVFNDSKPMSKAAAAAANGESKLVQETVADEEQVFQDGNISTKKKRGRPRKGMEKHPPNNKLKKGKPDKIQQRATDSETRSRIHERYGKESGGNDKPIELSEAPRKRRGRPKKTKEIDTSPINRIMGDATPDVLETSTPNSIGTCQTQTTSSVSSGYSTGTNSSSDLDRRQETGSLSNAGSGGPSPSHHSFTTQSDLSSEISAAISCGSPPPSPLNSSQTESVFDGLVALSQTREESHNNGQPNKMSSSISCRPQGNVYNPTNMGNSMDSQESYNMLYHQPTYDNRIHNLSNRSQNYQSSHTRDGSSDGSVQSGPQYSSQYETKALDVASKSLSGLESLVDQIPSIADADVGVVPVSSGGCLSGLVSDSLLHSQPMSQLGSSSSMTHSGHYMESPSGFLPYSHGPSPSTYSSAASHYATSPYYASELSSSFPVNSLAPTYCSPSATSGLMFGYPGYPGQYGGGAGYPHSASSGLHLSSSYGTPPGYPHAYPNPSHYPHGHPMSSSNGQGSQRFNQRLHLRQDGMDLGHMGFGGF